MDGALNLSEVIIYSAQYAQPPRAVSEGKEDGEKNPLEPGKKEKEEELTVEVLETMTHEYDSLCGTSFRDVSPSVLPTIAGSVISTLPFGSATSVPSVSRVNWQGHQPLITTDLDELPKILCEPDYINLRGAAVAAPLGEVHSTFNSRANGNKKTFTNSYGCEENIYEEINELQRRLALDKSISMETQRQQQQQQKCHPHQGPFDSHRQTNSLIDEVMDEVARVQVGHDTVLSQLNLDFEDFLQPKTPEPPPIDHVTNQVTNAGCSVSAGERAGDQVTQSHPNHQATSADKEFLTPSPSRRAPHKFTTHNRSNSSVSVTSSLVAVGGERSLIRCESLDLAYNDCEFQRRSSVVSRGSTSSSISTRSDTRQSIRYGIQQGLQKANQGLAGWTEKCSSLLTRQSKKMISLVNKDRRSTCDADSLDASSPASCDFGSFIPVKTPSTCSAGEQHDGATIFTATPPQIHPLSKEAASLQGTIVVDSQENQIYEDIVDHNSVTTNSKTSQHGPESSVATTVTNTDSGFSSARRRKLAAGSDDSWGSGEFESFSSDEEEDEVSRKVHSPTRTSGLRTLLLTGKSIRNKLRGSRGREGERNTLGMDCSVSLNNTPVSSVGQITSPPSGERRFSRLFSLKRSSTAPLPIASRENATPSSSSFSSASSSFSMGLSPYASPFSLPASVGTAKPDNTIKGTTATKPLPLPQLLEEEEIMFSLGLGHSSLFQRRHQPPTLPPIPANLNTEQIKRRYIVASIIHSENSYVASLQRLVNDYKKPLEESNPPFLSISKMTTLFHRVPEILQCHTQFRLALSECVRSWDVEEKIGDVFVANFSKALVLDIYSDFINNFSLALDIVKQESKRKSAFADFLKVKQISAHDRLSFFGLMVKPIQRFPQFILLLQDLLKHTPHDHVDRMSLQLALTQLESLAELLNERKRESEQYQAFRETLKRVSGKFSLRPLADNNRFLLRQDDVHLVELNQAGMISKTKERRLLLLNDLVVCVSVASKVGDDYRNSSERLTLKWAFPVTDVEVEDTSTSPTLSRLLSPTSNIQGSNMRSSETVNGVDSLCQEMNKLMHDYDVITRISSLINSLHGQYDSLNPSSTQAALSRIQQKLQHKDEEMAWIDSCCLQLIIKSRSGREERPLVYHFQTESPVVKKDWVIELRLAQLAASNSSPSWDIPEQEKRPSTKMPLFVNSMAVHKSNHETEVCCGCFYTVTQQKMATSARYLSPRLQNYLWLMTSDGISSHVTLLAAQQPVGPSFKEVCSFSLFEVKVSSVEFSPGVQHMAVDGEPISACKSDLVWLGTESRRVLLYSAQNPDKTGQVGSLSLPASVVQLRYHWEQMFVALANGTVAIFKRHCTEGSWDLNGPATVVALGNEPVSCLLPIGATLYATCGRIVFVLDGGSGDILQKFTVQQNHGGSIRSIAHSGIGLWIALKNCSIISLYHTETFRHLQDINLASSVKRTFTHKTPNSIQVTALMASKGLLWVGTNIGIGCSIPLPRLEGVPIISGRANVSFHVHSGPINFFLPLQMREKIVPLQPVTPPSLPLSTSLPNPPSGTIQEESENESKSPSGNETKDISERKTRTFSFESPLMLRRRNKESSPVLAKRMSRTLPRGHVSSLSTTEFEIFGLYGELMNVKGYDETEGRNIISSETGSAGIYETLRRSDPDLAAIPNKVSTLDRRLHMKAARPRSLDLSNWSVDSRSSLYTSSGSEDSASHTHTIIPSGTTCATTTTCVDSAQRTMTLKRPAQQRNSSKPPGDTPRTVLILSGGRGYNKYQQDNNERKNSVPSPPNMNDAHIILWEMKL